MITALADGSLHVDPVITHTFTVTDAHQAFEVAADPRQSSKVLLAFA